MGSMNITIPLSNSQPLTHGEGMEMSSETVPQILGLDPSVQLALAEAWEKMSPPQQRTAEYHLYHNPQRVLPTGGSHYRIELFYMPGADSSSSVSARYCYTNATGQDVCIESGYMMCQESILDT